MADSPRKVEGIGPTTKDGMPVTLRSEVKDPSRWYKKMYDTIHKNKYDDDYVTIRYKNRRGQPPQRVTNKSQYAYFDPRSGYLSEPEGGLSRLGSSTWSDAYDSDVTTGPRRRTASVQEERRISDATSPYLPNNKYSTLASARASQEVYKNQPGRIENYVPGKSSVVDKEAKQQNISSTTSLPQASPKEKKDLTSTILSKSNMARALKESGYESDSTLVFRRRDDTEAPLSPAERRAAYRDLQAGGEPPLRGFRSPAPPRTETDSAPEPPRRTPHGSYSDTESPRRYLESDVNIHYRCPVRHDPLPLVPERELARQQAEHMKKLYREQRRNKYLQELQDMQNRRHQDNFTPSQKNILPLNRYDEAERVVARALYAFNGQTARELSFRKGDLIHVRRQIDANWYEGEIHGRIGLFPYNYVEIMKGEVAHSPKKPAVIEGRARAKFDFTAQTNLELPLKKGEVVVLTRRIDQNWWEGRNGTKTGIFPDSYVTILQEPSQSKPEPHPTLNTDKPVASPAAHGLLNGTAKRSMGAHSYMPQPNNPALGNAPPATQPLPGYAAKPAQATLTPAERGYGPPTGAGVDLNNTEPLYVDTNAEAVPYRAMYKYRPQNPDELELNEGDTVYVLEKCDDGWYVGSSQRTGRFGTFPGNYVERI
ncbi:sorbin and SH3 domain-containing protein 2 isoform X3 [Ostrinia furnacalis]|uniref:sorbin and SH3 domain-containing protein 2 isoform X3 n=1 Tax=Ostrinia furnacalis TaxID=93504 RepID=UPI00103E04E0|nr:sorbin and SH3 domain-containing protein 2 isoform X3 [Ostrinia furnacalis]